VTARRAPWLLGLTLLALLLGSAAPARAQLAVSPGFLARGHAAVEQTCSACHVPFRGVPDDRCVACHLRIGEQQAQGRGWHATVKADRCVTCHADHQGRGHSMVPALPATFRHEDTGYTLAGKHASIACVQCHPAPAKGGAQRWVGTSTQCSTCHADRAHRGALGATCEACHGEASFRPATRTLASHTTAMDGGHLGKTCEDCHRRGRNLTSAVPCEGCHRQPHGGTKVICQSCHTVASWKALQFKHAFCSCLLPGKHQTAPCLACHQGFRFDNTPKACEGCHESDRPHEPLGGCARCHTARSWKDNRFDHNRKPATFAITGQHQTVDCEGCHPVAGKFRNARQTCSSCHAIPRHGDFGACERCHTTQGFTPSSFQHASTRFPLQGKHAAVACEVCHTAFVPGGFRPGPDACGRCHHDPHGGQFQAGAASAPIPGHPGVPAAPGVSGPGSPAGTIDPGVSLMGSIAIRGSSTSEARPGAACPDCHTVDGWKPSLITADTHGRYGFPLDGQHRQAPCAQCHAGGAFVGTPHACSACHADDRHRNKLGSACERCHTPRGWAGATLDHGKETGFALTAAHLRAPCQQCHGEHGIRLAGVPTAKATACQSCHAPRRHGAQFGAACAECHRPTRFADVPAIDHEQRAGFALERRHATVACLACHDAQKRIAVNRNCQTCHGDPHRASNGYLCEDCHREDRWRAIRFDHDRTDYPLTGRHATTSCGRCHTNPIWTGLRGECVACHGRDRPRTDDHLVLSDCGECHTTASWRSIR
jgi:hypothetical protein